MRTVFDVGKKEKKVRDLEKETQKPDFWQNKEEAIKITQELTRLQGEIDGLKKLREEFEALKGLAKDEQDFREFEEKLSENELLIYLSDKYDKGNCVLSIYAGAGGQDAQDWATMLLRMYERYCVLKNFKTKILHQSFGQGGGPEGRIGTKSVTLEVTGRYAFGILKNENGVHRLVRISPFSAKSLRHTSFALVEVLPDISQNEETEIKIRPEELKTETFRASGPGGQYVNRRESAVRITHLPTGITVSCQSERLQGLNREKAIKILLAKLYRLKEEKNRKEIKEIKGKNISASWGNQIRSYVLHPYKLVKDLRTGLENSDTEGVLDGNLENFISTEITASHNYD